MLQCAIIKIHGSHNHETASPTPAYHTDKRQSFVICKPLLRYLNHFFRGEKEAVKCYKCVPNLSHEVLPIFGAQDVHAWWFQKIFVDGIITPLGKNMLKSLPSPALHDNPAIYHHVSGGEQLLPSKS